jgi:hypothetical protein
MGIRASRRAHVRVAQHPLDSVRVDSSSKEIRGTAVPKGVEADRSGNGPRPQLDAVRRTASLSIVVDTLDVRRLYFVGFALAADLLVTLNEASTRQRVLHDQVRAGVFRAHRAVWAGK